MKSPDPIPKHSPEHQRHICRFLRIPLSEYESWWSNHNFIRGYVHWKKMNHDLMVAADLAKEKEEATKKDSHS
jgi:hypothetical protein